MASVQLGVTELLAGQNGAEIIVNQMLYALDATVFLSVKGYQSAPPGSPVEGDRYLILPTGSGAWLALGDEKLALRRGGAWIALTPKDGWRCGIDGNNDTLTYIGTYPTGVWSRIQRQTVQANIACAGTTQGAATLLTSEICHVATATGGVNDSVRLPLAMAGMNVFVVNRSGATINIYPGSGDTIDDAAANAAVTLATGKSRLLKSIDTTDWFSLLGA